MVICICVHAYVCVRHVYHDCNETDITAHEVKSNTLKEGVVYECVRCVWLRTQAN